MDFKRAWKIIWRNTLIFSVFNTLYYVSEWLWSWPGQITDKVMWTIKITDHITKTIILPWPNYANIILNPLGLIIFGIAVFGVYKLLENKYQIGNKSFPYIILIVFAAGLACDPGLGLGFCLVEALVIIIPAIGIALGLVVLSKNLKTIFKIFKTIFSQTWWNNLFRFLLAK